MGMERPASIGSILNMCPKSYRAEWGCELGQKSEVSRTVEFRDLLGPNPGLSLVSSTGRGPGQRGWGPAYPSMVLPLASSVLRAACWAGVSRGQRCRFCSTWGSETTMLDASMSHTRTPRSRRSEALSRAGGPPCRTAGQRQPGPTARLPILSHPRGLPGRPRPSAGGQPSGQAGWPAAPCPPELHGG